jgi:hypothetical protein
MGGQIMGAKMRAEGARMRAAEAAREADRAGAEAWSIRMEGYGGPAQPSPTIAQCLNGGLGWLEVECNSCRTRASIPLDAIRRPRDTPIWKLEAALKCRSCKKARHAPQVHMIQLTQERERSLPTSGCIRMTIDEAGAITSSVKRAERPISGLPTPKKWWSSLS